MWYDSYEKLAAFQVNFSDGSSLRTIATTNKEGDVLGLYSLAGEQLVSYEYDSWGNFISFTDNSGVGIGTLNPIRYRGYYFDEETGLYYLQSRYYDPQTGRFLNADGYVSTGQGLLGNNMFIYCGNNPIMYADPSGESSAIAYAFHKILEEIIEETVKVAIKGIGTLLVAYGANKIAENVISHANSFAFDFASEYNYSDTKSQEKTVAIPNSQNFPHAVFYGADLRGGNWKKVTDAMSYEDAKIWVITSSVSGIYGKSSSWGLYTYSGNEAAKMAWDLGNGNVPIFHKQKPNIYPHFHVNGFTLFGKHEHFHLWYGELG